MLFQQFNYRPVVPFDADRDSLVALDLTAHNQELNAEVVNDTDRFAAYISDYILRVGARYAIGGYNEHRTVYSRSTVFDAAANNEEPRRLHLGTDIWGMAGTPVFTPLDGVVHSFAFNDQFGDYGATIIIEHNLLQRPKGDAAHKASISDQQDVKEQNAPINLPDKFFILYGHLSVRDIADLKVGEAVAAGQEIAHFGEPWENGHWPPHLHFQVIKDIGSCKGDYPGVCRFSERSAWLANCPDPEIMLQMNQFINGQENH